MADTIREALSLQWSGTDTRQEASVEDLRGVVTRDVFKDAFVFGAFVYCGNRMVARSTRFFPNVGSMNAGKEFCEIAMGAEFWRRET